MMNSQVPIGRLAPSPTGALHLGNARTFMLAWLSIRSRGGRLIMRIEDLDHPRVKPNAAEDALTDLRWLGFDWDEGPDEGGCNGPYEQSKRKAIYRVALSVLKARGLVYPCACSRGEVESVQSAPHADEHMLVYPGICRGKFSSWEDAAATMSDGRLPVWRFKSSGGISQFTDRLHGDVFADIERDVGDFALARDAHGAGYTLACVVDDAAMGVTEVVRGDDLLMATHSHVALQNALGFPRPEYVHVPMVVAEDGHRLAKRHGDTRICSLREAGVSPRRIIGLLAWWCGWLPFGSEASLNDLLNGFSWDSLKRDPAVLSSEVKTFLGI